MISNREIVMRSCILSFCLVFMSVVNALAVHAVPPDRVTFITELFGYQGEYYDYSCNTGYTWHPSLDLDTDGDLWVCSTGRVFEYRDEVRYDHTEASGGGDYVSITSQGMIWVSYHR